MGEGDKKISPLTASVQAFKKQILVLLTGLTAFAVVFFMPLPEGMTPEAKRLLAVVLMMAVWWIGEGTSVTATALMPLVLFRSSASSPARKSRPITPTTWCFCFSAAS